jgi:regulator of protease activity HflC (stomatin/prohibitin superfamily)
MKDALKKMTVTVCIILLIGFTYYVLNRYVKPITLQGEKYGPGTLATYLMMIYLAASVRIVGPQKVGAVLLLGRPWFDVSSGPVLVPLLIASLVTEKGTIIQDELPADPEKIYRKGDGDPEGNTVPPELQAIGMRPPIRVTFSGRNDAVSRANNIADDDPYDRRLTAEVVPVVRWKIISYKVFLQTIGSIDEARRQMEDSSIGVFNDLLAPVSPAVAMLKMSETNSALKTEIAELVKDWGVALLNAEIKTLRFSRTLNSAVQNVVIEERNKRASIYQGEGQGGKERAILAGRSAGLKQMVEDLELEDGKLVLGAETARAIAGEGDKSSQRTIIAGAGGFAELVGVGAAIAKSVNNKGDTP